jgi:hypothetical protein
MADLVIPDPEFHECEIGPENEYLIVASDGLWDVVSGPEAVQKVSYLWCIQCICMGNDIFMLIKKRCSVINIISNTTLLRRFVNILMRERLPARLRKSYAIWPSAWGAATTSPWS